MKAMIIDEPWYHQILGEGVGAHGSFFPEAPHDAIYIRALLYTKPRRDPEAPPLDFISQDN